METENSGLKEPRQFLLHKEKVFGGHRREIFEYKNSLSYDRIELLLWSLCLRLGFQLNGRSSNLSGKQTKRELNLLNLRKQGLKSFK